MSNLKISIAIPVYNGEKDINRCLKSIMEQTADPELFEVIVVNNNSTDKTVEIAKSFYGKIKNFKIIDEPKIGLSNARNRGYKEALSEYVAYIDDDTKLRSNYIEKAIKIIEEISPDIFGGPIYPFYISEKPDWFKDQYEIRLEQKESGFMKTGTLSGSNMIFKKQILEEYKGFSPDLGMKGNRLGYGEETYLIEKALKEKKKIYYDIDLIVEHIVPKYKMNILYFIIKPFIADYNLIITNQQNSISYLDELTYEAKSFFNEIEKMLKNPQKEKIENFLIENNKLSIFSHLGQLVANFEKYKLRRIKKSRKNILTKIINFIKKIFN